MSSWQKEKEKKLKLQGQCELRLWAVFPLPWGGQGAFEGSSIIICPYARWIM
jgi:hypothetical protein